VLWEQVDLHGNGYEYECEYVLEVLEVNVWNRQARPGCVDDRDGSYIFKMR